MSKSARRWAAVGALCLLRHAEAVELRAASHGYLCILSNGTTVVSVHDISKYFPDSVRGCSGGRAPAARSPAEGKVPRILRDPIFIYDSEEAVTPTPAPPGAQAAWQDLAPPVRPGSDRASPKAFDDLIFDACARYGVDPHLVKAVIDVESAHQPHARSPKGALGLMQVMPATGERYGVFHPRQLLEPARNIDVGTRYLRDLYELFNGRIELIPCGL